MFENLIVPGFVITMVIFDEVLDYSLLWTHRSQLGETWIFLTRRKVEVWRALCASFGMQCIFHNCNHEFAPGVMSSGCSAAACAALAEVTTTLLPFYGNQAGVMWGWECLVFVCKLRLGIHRIQQSNSASEWETAEA